MRSWIALVIAIAGVIVAFLIICLTISSVSASPIYIAQNDSAQFMMANSHGTCWYFPAGERLELVKLYDIPADSNNNTWSCNLNGMQTSDMHTGTYDLVYTYPGIIYNNGAPRYIKDVSWQNDSLVSIFGKSVDESGKQGSMVQTDLEQLTATSLTDSVEHYQFEIQEPSLTITRQEQTNNHTILVSGNSNMAGGTFITIKIDEADHVAEKDSANYTFDSVVVRDSIAKEGKWSCNMSVSVTGLAPGWHMTTAYAKGVVATARFPIYQTWEPSPTPTQYINYFGNGTLKPDIVTVTVPGPIQYVDRWYTATPTPDITDALGGKVDYPYTAGSKIPDGIGIAALLCMAAIVVVRREK